MTYFFIVMISISLFMCAYAIITIVKELVLQLKTKNGKKKYYELW